jgi:hypothetical protein
MNALLFRLLDNEISDGEFAQLEDWLHSDTQAKQYYCRFMEDYSSLSLGVTTAALQDGAAISLQDETLNDSFWKLLSAEEANAPAVTLVNSEPEQKTDIIRKVRKERIVRSVNKTSLVLAVASLAAILLMIAYVYHSGPAPYAVATLVDSMGAEWSFDLPLKAGTAIATQSRPIRLTQGIVKLITDQQVEIVLEAPTEFRFISYSEIALGYGKLFATVSDQGRGFSVTTSNSKIVDLGTEFGVISQIDGNTEVHLYKGTANLFAGQKDDHKISELLMAGAAKKVDRTDAAVEEIALDDHVVVRHIDSKANFIWRGESLNLADVVGGGNGFGTGYLDRGIDPSTGDVTQLLSRIDVYAGPKGYVSSPSNSYIDGVFIPGADGAVTQINADGLRTDEFPRTSGSVWGYVFNGAWHESDDTPHHHLKLDGMTLDGRKTPAITLHSNLGITFDLSAIRKQLPGVHIKSFASRFGVSETVEKTIRSRTFGDLKQTPDVEKIAAERRASAEFWVLLDGKKVMQQTVFHDSKAHSINVPIGDDVHYLTLAVTEADDTCMFDWGVFARPELMLESAGR